MSPIRTHFKIWFVSGLQPAKNFFFSVCTCVGYPQFPVCNYIVPPVAGLVKFQDSFKKKLGILKIHETDNNVKHICKPSKSGLEGANQKSDSFWKTRNFWKPSTGGTERERKLTNEALKIFPTYLRFIENHY